MPVSTSTPDRLLSSSDAARRIGITRARLAVLAAEGVIPFEMTGAGRIFRQADVDAFVEARRRSGRRVKLPPDP